MSFGFLGYAFYQASGGGAYEPAPGSLQVVMRDTPLFAAPRIAVAPAPESALNSEVASAEPSVTPDLSRKRKWLDHAVAEEPDTVEDTSTHVYPGLSDDDATELTLASARETLSDTAAVAARPVDDIGIFSAETLVRDVSRIPIEEAIITPQHQADIRSVIGSSANMRSGPGTEFGSLDQLARGTQVEVLDRRGAWVELRNKQTGQTGWMADWLITAHN